MKALVILGIAATLIAAGPAQAARLDLSEVDIVSVAPRGADVRPLVMSVPAEIRLKSASESLDRTNASPGQAELSGARGPWRHP
jgi:hypothetical protein